MTSFHLHSQTSNKVITPLFTSLVTVSTVIGVNLFSMVLADENQPIKENTEETLADQNSVKKPKFIKVNATTYRLGVIEIDTKKRSISFDATTEITENLIEYILVNPEGKIHESLFVTNASPTNLNIAFKLLGFQENKSLFREFVNDLPTETFQEASDEQKAESYFKIDVSWLDPKSNKPISHNINELIINEQTKETIGTAESTAKWSYGGSFIHKGQFIAELNRE